MTYLKLLFAYIAVSQQKMDGDGVLDWLNQPEDSWLSGLGATVKCLLKIDLFWNATNVELIWDKAKLCIYNTHFHNMKAVILVVFQDLILCTK